MDSSGSLPRTPIRGWNDRESASQNDFYLSTGPFDGLLRRGIINIGLQLHSQSSYIFLGIRRDHRSLTVYSAIALLMKAFPAEGLLLLSLPRLFSFENIFSRIFRHRAELFLDAQKFVVFCDTIGA